MAACRDLADLLPGSYTEAGMILQAGDPGCGRPLGFDPAEFPEQRMIRPVQTQQSHFARLQQRFAVDQSVAVNQTVDRAG